MAGLYLEVLRTYIILSGLWIVKEESNRPRQSPVRKKEGVRGFAAPDLTGRLLAAELPYRRSCLPLPHRVCQGRKSQQFLQPSEEKRNAIKSPKGKGRVGAAEPQKPQGKANKATGQSFPWPGPSSDASGRS